MRHTVYKLLWGWEYDKEEKWLNEMAAQGKALVSVGFCKYIFEDTEPGEYTIKIELLDNMASSPRSKSYIRFLEETGAEHIGSIFRWIYVRKKASNGALDLYSDIGSKIRYMKRLQTFFISLTIFELFIGIMNLAVSFLPHNQVNGTNLFFGFLLLFIAVMCAIAAVSHTKKLRNLQRERLIRE